MSPRRIGSATRAELSRSAPHSCRAASFGNFSALRPFKCHELGTNTHTHTLEHRAGRAQEGYAAAGDAIAELVEELFAEADEDRDGSWRRFVSCLGDLLQALPNLEIADGMRSEARRGKG